MARTKQQALAQQGGLGGGRPRGGGRPQRQLATGDLRRPTTPPPARERDIRARKTSNRMVFDDPGLMDLIGRAQSRGRRSVLTQEDRINFGKLIAPHSGPE